MSGDGSEAVAVYATFPDMAVAERIGASVVEEGLAACANLTPGMRSVYRWKGAIERAEEVVGILKTSRAKAPALIAAIEAAHPYETPAIVVLPIEAGSAGYLRWIAEETRG
jgi:periplasmic divalent cation tolerance protein